MRATIVYAAQRAALFLVPFVVLMIAQVPWYVSLLVALVFAFCASYIFLRRSRSAALAELQQLRERRSRDDDESVEDAISPAEPADERAADERRNGDATPR